MIYKQIKWLIKKEDFCKHNIITNTFILELEQQSVIFGTVKLKDDELAIGFGVVLEEKDKTTNISVDKCFTFTNEYGKYYISFIPLKDKIYTVTVYRFINIK